MEELTASEQFEVENILNQRPEQLGCIDQDERRRYLLRQVEADLAVNEVQKNIKQKKDFYKRKAELIRREYFAFLLIKNP